MLDAPLSLAQRLIWMQPIAPTVHHLFELVSILDPGQVTWEGVQERARLKCAELAAEIERQRERYEAGSRLREVLESAAANIEELSHALNNSAGAAQWRRLYAALAKNYEQLTKAIEARQERLDTPIRGLSRQNYSRNVFHIAGGLSAALITHFLITEAQALIIMIAFVGMAIFLEVLRRFSHQTNETLMGFWLFRKIARPHEYYRINSSTWYALGLLLIVVLFTKLEVEIACIVLAFADPVASNIGRRFGRTKIFRGKSIAGTAAFFVTAGVITAVYLFALFGLSPTVVLAFAAAAAAAGALAELYTIGVDDNFSVPVAVATAVWLAGTLL